ncbi:formate dehydrogenase accessory sulfurtransferase FdhD [Candidatus Rariloculus sp.]|uniref:formate dehydrogenase accessory sulfurtransferase FdhD n=1 Tax=Candidatus Rariloculus sp. TaxID=3101265 RepID=UPI003D1312C9
MSNLREIVHRQSVRQFGIQRIGVGAGSSASADTDVVATEEPLEIRLGYSRPDGGQRTEQSISITMRTPGNDEELALGFLFTEAIIAKREDVASVGPCGPPAENGLINVVRVELADDVAVDLDRLERHFYTSSSCGVCGKASIEAVSVQGRFDLHADGMTIGRDVIASLPEKLVAAQSVFAETGGLHASGLFDARGEIAAVREDVGRHNALDKLVGSRLKMDALPLTGLGIIVSGRASFELMQKAMVAGCPLVAAVGAPSSLAVELAAEFGMTLIGFLKRDRFNAYARPDRIA